MDFKNMTIAERLRYLLETKNLTQVELAHKAGVTKSAISNYVNGNRVPDTFTSLKLAQIFNISMEWLLTGEGVIKSDTTYVDLSIDEKMILNTYNKLNDVEKEKYHVYGLELLEKRVAQTNNNSKTSNEKREKNEGSSEVANNEDNNYSTIH